MKTVNRGCRCKRCGRYHTNVKEYITKPVKHTIYTGNKCVVLFHHRRFTYTIIDSLLKSYKAEEQAYRGCLSILKLADRYEETRLEKACKLALSHLSRPGYKNIKMILEANQDLKEDIKDSGTDDSFAFIRGGEYYGSKNK